MCVCGSVLGYFSGMVAKAMGISKGINPYGCTHILLHRYCRGPPIAIVGSERIKED